MKLSDVLPRLQAPLPSHIVNWKPGALNKTKNRALMMAFIDARAVMDRLDCICPDDWSFDAVEVSGAKVPTVRGTLTVLGVSRTDFGEGDPSSEAGDSYKAAASDALKRCAVHFGIGRYLYDLPKVWVDWDNDKRQPLHTPELPAWARPEHERTPGGAHLMQAMEQLRYELPEDLELQREVYKHLKAALGSLHPVTAPLAQGAQREAESEGDPMRPTEAPQPISKATKQRLAAHLSRRWQLSREMRLPFTAWLAGRGFAPLASSQDLTEAEGQAALAKLSEGSSRDLLSQWSAEAEAAGLVEAVA